MRKMVSANKATATANDSKQTRAAKQSKAAKQSHVVAHNF
jgi:hypothetical protein